MNPVPLAKLRIRITCDPHPHSTTPKFVKDAYEGLQVTSVRRIETGVIPEFPNGAYLVAMSEIIRAMSHKAAAHEWMQSIYGGVCEIAKECSLEEPLIVIPYEYCEVVQ